MPYTRHSCWQSTLKWSALYIVYITSLILLQNFGQSVTKCALLLLQLLEVGNQSQWESVLCNHTAFWQLFSQVQGMVPSELQPRLCQAATNHTLLHQDLLSLLSVTHLTQAVRLALLLVGVKFEP